MPTLRLGDRLLVGFAGPEGRGCELEAWLDRIPAFVPASTGPPAVRWFAGRPAARSAGFPLFTLAIGLLDGFNPCCWRCVCTGGTAAGGWWWPAAWCWPAVWSISPWSISPAIAAAAKPGIYAPMRQVMQVHSLPLALAAVLLLGPGWLF